MLTRIALLAIACASTCSIPALAAPSSWREEALHVDDEPIAVSRHTVRTVKGPLSYEARAGRIALRNDETGQLRGYLYFTAYSVKTSDKSARPLTFLWNGGPTTNSHLVHVEMFGPRRMTAAGMTDNAETLLTDSDLVFFDPVGTGFSRAVPGAEAELLSTLGDFAATAEFVRAWRARFGAERQPLFLGGESYGTWRVNGTTELLEKRGIRVNGAILISGGVPGSLMPPEFQDAMYLHARTAAAFELGRLEPELMRDRAETLAALDRWASETYMPALARVRSLSTEEREGIAAQLARFTGVRADQIDRNTLVMNNNAFKAGFFDGQADKVLDTYDLRIVGKVPEAVPDRARIFTSYLRDELGYRSDLAYTGLEDGYMPMPGPERRSTGLRWSYNHVELTPEAISRMRGGGGPPLSQPWLQNAMRVDPALRVFVAAGRYDSLNMCEGNVRMSAKLEPALAQRFTHRCYEGGHMMYRDQPTRLQMARDIAEFIRSAAR